MMSSILLFVACGSQVFLSAENAGHIVGDDVETRYPVSSAREYSTPDYVLADTTVVVAGGGDVNGDGYVDVVMSSHNSSAGYALVYLGTADGFDESTYNTMFRDLYDDEVLDYVPVAFAGDVNADGYDELIISDPADERVNVYLGTPSGVSTNPAWTLAEFAGHATESGFNDPLASVAGAGDVNGDGYDDIIVGVPTNEVPGHATVYLGSSSGLRTDESAVVLDANTGIYDGFGLCVSGAGDVNGDGYADVIVGALNPYVAVYYGSATGVSETEMTVLDAGVASVTGAGAVSGAGDVNGDGYDDVVIGVQDVSNRSRGVVLVFQGGASGISSTPVWTREGETDTDFYGWSVAGAGDVNGDGYGDVITGTEQIPEIFLGSAAGLETEPVAVLATGGQSVSGAGDVDRDGLDDVVVAGGNVFLAATFLDSGSSDTDSDSDADTDIGSEGCQGKQGCATAPSGSFPVDGALLALGVAATRRRQTPTPDR